MLTYVSAEACVSNQGPQHALFTEIDNLGQLQFLQSLSRFNHILLASESIGTVHKCNFGFGASIIALAGWCVTAQW